MAWIQLAISESDTLPDRGCENGFESHVLEGFREEKCTIGPKKQVFGEILGATLLRDPNDSAKACAALEPKRPLRGRIHTPCAEARENMRSPLEVDGMAKKKSGAKKPAEMLLVQSKVKEYVRGHDMMCSSDLVEALNQKVAGLLDEAVGRASNNGRKTARAHDI